MKEKNWTIVAIGGTAFLSIIISYLTNNLLAGTIVIISGTFAALFPRLVTVNRSTKK